MSVLSGFWDMHGEMRDWRRDIHANPEIGFQEQRTAAIVADKLQQWGYEVCRLTDTGVVGTLTSGRMGRTIGIRADMDALPMDEQSDHSYRSRNKGVMHACGHDGHTTVLLGAARHLAQNPHFNGKIHLIFQPAEEGLGGAARMIEAGLFERFPCGALYGLHNDPNIPLGSFAIKKGVVTAASVRFWIEISGRGGHASRPHDTIDPVLIGSLITVSLQSIVSRRVDPAHPAVLSVTQFHSGTTGNVIPPGAVLNGTIRAHNPDLHEELKRLLVAIATQTAATHGASATIRFEGNAPSTINAEVPTAVAIAAATSLVGAEQVILDRPTEMVGEDFAEMALRVPSCFVFAGQAEADRDNWPLHHPRYDFNDNLLPYGAALWSRIVETELP
jgi:amidohydrolase